MSFEQTIIQGNVGRDADLRYTPSGKAVCTFSVAVNAGNKAKWYRVTVWESLAETCAQHVHKGMAVLCVGTVEASAYTDRTGVAAATLELTARVVQFIGARELSEEVTPEAVEDYPF